MRKAILFLIAIFFTTNAFAANTLKSGVKITKIDATSYNGDIKVQTDPRPSMVGLDCDTSNGGSGSYWLFIKASHGNVTAPNYDALVAFTMAAKYNNSTVSIGADDGYMTGGFCELSRIVID